MVATLQAPVVGLWATIAELQATILELRATSVRLEQRVRDSGIRMGRHMGKTSRPPSSDLPGAPKRRLPDAVAVDAVANTFTSPTSGPLSNPDASAWRPAGCTDWAVGLGCRGLHREQRRPCRPQTPCRNCLAPSYPGRGITSHQVRVPN